MITKLIKRSSAAAIDCAIKLYTHAMGNQSLPVMEPLPENCRVVMICLDNLGDIVMATSAIEAFKSVFPEASLTVITRPPYEAVFLNNPYVDGIVVDEAPWWSAHPVIGSLRPGYWTSWFGKIARMRREKWDVVIDLRGDLRHILLFGVVIRPKILLGYGRTGGESLLSARVAYDPQKHEIDKKLELLRPLGIVGVRPKPKIWLTSEEVDSSRELIVKRLGVNGSPILLIDPGAKPIQQWPLERFAHLARSLSSHLHRPMLVSTGPSFTPLARQLVSMTGAEVVRFVGDMSVRGLAALVAACDLVISCDTGVAHIASAVGTRAVTLFGPTDPTRFWHGMQEGQIVRSSQPSCTRELHLVCKKSKRNFPGACMLSISEEMVEEAVYKALGNLTRGGLA